MRTNWIVGLLLGSVGAIPAAAEEVARVEIARGTTTNDDIIISSSSSSKNLRGDHPVVRTGRTIETFDIDLDLPPEDRWAEVMAKYGTGFSKIGNFVIDQLIPEHYLPKFLAAFDLVEEFWPNREYRRELEGIARATDLSVGLVLVLNLTYELVAGCTSIVGRSADGTVWHGRNLDFDVPFLQEITVNVRFVRNGATLFEGTTYAGYIGILTGSKPGAFSLSQDERYTGTPVWENLLEFLTTRGAAEAYPFFYREIFETVDTYHEALEVLQTTPLIAPAYAIIAGAGPGQGAVVSRDRNAAADTWEIGEHEWFLVETNDDHWKPPEDDRRDAANRGMSRLTPETIGPDSLMAVMATRPVLNELTTYTAVMNPGTGYYASVLRNADNNNDNDNHNHNDNNALHGTGEWDSARVPSRTERS